VKLETGNSKLGGGVSAAARKGLGDLAAGILRGTETEIRAVLAWCTNPDLLRRMLDIERHSLMPRSEVSEMIVEKIGELEGRG